MFDTTLSRDHIDRMVGLIDSEWRVCDTTKVDGGHHCVYKIAVATSCGNEELYLKATPAEKEPTTRLEARLLSVLEAHTGIPTPTIRGVVDEHAELPAPFVVMSAIPGRTIPETEMASLADETLRSIARDSGRLLADLHAVNAVDDFGYPTEQGPVLRGERPSGTVETIGVADPITTWREWLRRRAETSIEVLPSTRFSDLTSRVASTIHTRIDDIRGPFAPVLARVDQSWGNVVLDDGTLSGLVDWEYSLATSPDYDIVSVAWTLAGRAFLFDPTVPDRRQLVFDAVTAGYQAEGSASVIDRARENRPCYELLLALRAMVNLEPWHTLFEFGGGSDDAASTLRAEVATRL